jgi:hypothetical protein
MTPQGMIQVPEGVQEQLGPTDQDGKGRNLDIVLAAKLHNLKSTVTVRRLLKREYTGKKAKDPISARYPRMRCVGDRLLGPFLRL